MKPTLVLAPRITADCKAMAAAAERAGWQVHIASSWRLSAEEWVGHAPVLYAAPLFADVAAGPLGLALLDPPLDWLTTLPEAYRTRKVSFTTLAEARRQTGPLFVKPADDKSFPAKIYNTGNDLPDEEQMPGTAPVLISEPVVWEAEYRGFVLDRKLQALSPYLRYGELAQTDDGEWPAPPEERAEAECFQQSLFADSGVELPPAVVGDVGRIEGGGWAVVEANAAWGSGIYSCDPDMALPVVQRACVLEEHAAAEDSRWIRPAVLVEG
jgi:hypothetical protein